MTPPCRWLTRGQAGWPGQLEHLHDPPAGLWLQGRCQPVWPAVAIVGSRRATITGVDIARSLGRDLGGAGVQVISGFARGIDGAAHEGALESGGTTVAILGCGLDVVYPRGHEALRRRIEAAGALITEADPGAAPEAWRFPQRNRLIAALSAAVIVVEATERSGALSTARWAADLGRDVLAVPGSIRSDRSAGTNLLIRDGARPLLSVEDLFEAVPELSSRAAHAAGDGPGAADPLAPVGPRPAGRPVSRHRGPRGSDRAVLPPHPRGVQGELELPLREVLDQLGTDPVHPDELGSALGIPASALASRLTALELGGAITALPGGLVARALTGD
ncbi:MAG: DNA-processing protein DprA [Candidatus Dormibacteria bacterium]